MQLRSLHSAAAALAVASATCIGAGWSGVWPSQEHPRETYRQLSECYTGVYERCSVAGSTLPSGLTWWRSNRGDLVMLKARLKGAVNAGVWVKTNTTPECPSAAWLNAQLPTASDFPVLALTTLYQVASIPTNYFDYTPYRCLTGLGPFTDAGLAYPNGYTNASTAGGGAYFPSGQTNWYTTDYGWNQMPKILALLTVTSQAGSLVATNKFTGTSGPNYSNAWALAQAAAEANYQAQAGDSLYDPYGAIGYAGIFGNPDRWKGELYTSRFYCKASSGFSTGYSSFGEYFLYSLAYPTDGTITSSVYSALGSSLSETQYVAIANDQTNALGSGETQPFGNTNIPTWCSQPISASGANVGHVLGLTFSGSYPVRTYRRWTVPGGFVFY